jgi:cyclopropane-fatty-acyl-phospholipid synthase
MDAHFGHAYSAQGDGHLPPNLLTPQFPQCGVHMGWFLRQIFRRVVHGQSACLRVSFANGDSWQNRAGKPEVKIVFKTRSAEHRTILLGYVGFFEAFFESDVDIAGERAVGVLMRMAYSSDYQYRANPFVVAKRKFLEWRDGNADAAKARRNARRHYGLPFDFFRMMLGEDALYAEGYWLKGTESLAEAQRLRCDYICRKLMLRPGDRMVEVGSGWGTMAMLAAERYGAQVVNYGLVPEQNLIMQERLEQRGLAGQVRIVERDHRDLLHEPDSYDRYLSVGVYEHAGRSWQPAWIKSIATALKYGGVGMISTCSYMEQFATEFLTIKYIFPGGSVPSLPRTLELMEKSGLHVVDIEELGWHYQRTAEHWLTNFENCWPEIQVADPQVFTEKFRRIWIYYLCGVIEGFRPRGGNLNLHHITFTKGKGYMDGAYRRPLVCLQPDVEIAQLGAPYSSSSRPAS